MRLDARARQDVAILGSEFLKLDGKLFPVSFITCLDVGVYFSGLQSSGHHLMGNTAKHECLDMNRW